MTDFLTACNAAVPTGLVQEQEPMSRHTTFAAGGAARYYVTPGTMEELAQVIALCREQELVWMLLGKGSNLLVSDAGYDGVMISTAKLSECRLDGDELYAEAGCSLAKLAGAAQRSGYTGLEFAAGIPGTLGGAVVMNAGAYGGEMKDVLTEVQVLTPEGEPVWIPAEQMDLGYRHSCVAERGYAVLAAKMHLTAGDPAQIRAAMEDLAARRREKQPLEYPSAGSTFKRPEGYFAGKLIQDAGLRGFQVGGAQVSEKHCGFVINRDHATATDIWELCRQVQEKVREQFGVELQLEVRTVGEFQ